MTRISGFFISGCLISGLVCYSFGEVPDPLDFADRAVLPHSERNLDFLSKWEGRQSTDVLLIWDNGGFVTHPGDGLNGADVSMASEDRNVAGANVRQWEDNEFFRIAERFEIAESAGIVQVSTFAYEPFEVPPAWQSRNLRIWAGMPGEPDSEVLFEHEYETLDAVFTGVYRILHLDELTDTRRPIFEIRWDLTEALDSGPLWLEVGEYWIDWQVVEGETGWSVYVMEENLDEPDQPATVFGDALQLRPVGWTALEVATPFRVFGLSDDLFQDRFEGNGRPAEALN